MTIEDEYIRLIFGLKLKQIRTEKKLSLFGWAKLTGLSKSYLNEIEKGKKYPKTDKILILSEKLETPYDNLVSLKLDKNLAPIGEILQSNTRYLASNTKYFTSNTRYFPLTQDILSLTQDILSLTQDI